jgi:RNA polymerase-binding transcription factor DksA
MDSTAARLRLETEKSRLEGVLAAAGRLQGSEGTPQREGGRSDQLPAEQATETLERELDTSVEVRVRTELAEVEAALSRLDHGTYGRCEVCGAEIAENRLEAMPAARLCLADQARAGRDPRARFGH